MVMDICARGEVRGELLRLAAGTAFLVAIPIIAGVWLVGTSNQLAGMITISMGLILAIFMLAVMLSSPPRHAGRMGPAPD